MVCKSSGFIKPSYTYKRNNAVINESEINKYWLGIYDLNITFKKIKDCGSRYIYIFFI